VETVGRQKRRKKARMIERQCLSGNDWSWINPWFQLLAYCGPSTCKLRAQCLPLCCRILQATNLF